MRSDNDELADLASASPAVAEETDELSEQLLLVFRTGQRWFAIDPHRVHEVVVRGPVTQIPTAPSHVLGLSLVRGRLIPVISLQTLLAHRADGAPAQTLPRMIVLRVDGLEVALVCDETRGILAIRGRDGSPRRTATTGLKAGATIRALSSGTCPRSGTLPVPARSAGGPPPNATSSTTRHTKRADAPASVMPARSVVTTTGSSSTRSGRSTSSPTAPSGGPPQPGAPMTPNPRGTPYERPKPRLRTRASPRGPGGRPAGRPGRRAPG